MQYVGTAYNKLGSAKGSMILDILRGFGIDNISSLPHAMYGEFYARIEELLK